MAYFRGYEWVSKIEFFKNPFWSLTCSWPSFCRTYKPDIFWKTFHQTRSVLSTPADNTRKRVWQYIEKERKKLVATQWWIQRGSLEPPLCPSFLNILWKWNKTKLFYFHGIYKISKAYPHTFIHMNPLSRFYKLSYPYLSLPLWVISLPSAPFQTTGMR